MIEVDLGQSITKEFAATRSLVEHFALLKYTAGTLNLDWSRKDLHLSGRLVQYATAFAACSAHEEGAQIIRAGPSRKNVIYDDDFSDCENDVGDADNGVSKNKDDEDNGNNKNAKNGNDEKEFYS